MKQRILLIVFIISLLVLPQVVSAVSWWPLVPCGTSVNPTPCNQCDLFRLLKNIIDFVLIGLMPPVAAILFVWGGFLILMGGANPGLISQGKSIFWNTAIGVAIILSSWLITNSIIRSIAADNIAPEWWKFQCSVTTTGGGPPPEEKKYACQNNQCIESASGTYTEPTCDNSCGEVPPGETLSITTSSISDAIQNQSYSQTVQATGGKSPYNWSISGSSQLPSGLSINSSTGEISGKSTTLGDFTFTVMVQDSSSPVKQATKQLSIKVVSQAISVTISNVASKNITNTNAVITWTTDKSSTSQVAYGTTTAYGNITTLDINPVTNHTVIITGLTPGTTYNYQAISSVVVFTAKSSNYTFKTTGTTDQPILITTTSLPNATQSTAYSQALSATGGTVPYIWSISSGALPAGLSISGSNISGTPTTAGTFTFTVKVEDSSSPKQSAVKQLTIKINPTGTGAICKFTGVNLCQASNRTPYNSQTMVCSASACSQYVSDINQYAGRTKVSNGASFLKAIMIKESACNAQADSGHAQGLMQLKPSTAVIYANRCGVSDAKKVITPQWLKDNPALSICIAAEYMGALTQTSCGVTPRGVAAGYNGGSGACAQSVDCAGETSCDGSAVKRWECLYDNPEHTVCNDTRPGNYDETRDYAVKVLYCYNNPGF